MGKVKLFISYSHREKDKKGLEELLRYVNEQSCPDIEFWHDVHLALGQDWDNEIRNKLNTADIILLFMSPDFLLSPYITNNEVAPALTRHEKGEAIVIPVNYRYIPKERRLPSIFRFQGFPDPDTPIQENEAMTDRFYAEINAKLKEAANTILTNRNIARSKASGDERSQQARDIDHLKTADKIFVSIPAMRSSVRFREKFIENAESRPKFEKDPWRYQIIPSIEEADNFDDADQETRENLLRSWLNESIYHIHLIGDKNDLKTPDDFLLQYTLSKEVMKTRVLQNRTILWLLDSGFQKEIETLGPELSQELQTLKIIGQKDYNAIFTQIEDFDKEKEKTISNLSAGFSPKKKVYLFYDLQNDRDNALRINLRKKIQEHPDYVLREPLKEPFDEQELEKCQGAIIFYGTNSTDLWYRMRQDCIVEKENIKASAVCVDGAAEEEIQLKIDRDVSVNEVMPIKGAPELENGVTQFKTKLQEKL